MYTTVFKEMNFWEVKIEGLASSYNRMLGIFIPITDSCAIHVWLKYAQY